MASSLTGVGVVWACLSLISALGCCIAFYLPYWIQGRLDDRYDTFFGSFRRCNYPSAIQLIPDHIEIVQECGRYNNFWTIPTLWWKVSTILVGSGACLAFLVAAAAASGCCFSYVFTTGSARLSGTLQLVSVLLISFGAAAYPLGWYAPEVKEACGMKATVYNLGNCQLSWSTYLMGGSLIVLLLCAALSVKASKVKPGSIRL